MTENQQTKKDPLTLMIEAKERARFLSLDSMFIKYRSYFDGKYNSKSKNLELAIKVLLLVVFCQLFFNFLMINTVISISEKKEIHIEVARSIDVGTYTITPDWASESYHMMFAKSIVLDNTNFHFTNFEEKVNSMLDYTLHDVYIQSVVKLKEDVLFVKNNKISQTFKVSEWQFVKDPSANGEEHKRSKVIAKGKLTRVVSGITTIDGQPYNFPVDIVIRNGKAYLENFEPVFTGKVAKPKNNKKRKYVRGQDIETSRSLHKKKEQR